MLFNTFFKVMTSVADPILFYNQKILNRKQKIVRKKTKQSKFLKKKSSIKSLRKKEKFTI